MAKVWKFSKPLDSLDGIVEIEMQEGAKVMCIVNMYGDLAVYAQVNPEERSVTRRFRVLKDEGQINLPINAEYVGSAVFKGRLNDQITIHIWDLGVRDGSS